MLSLPLLFFFIIVLGVRSQNCTSITSNFCLFSPTDKAKDTVDCALTNIGWINMYHIPNLETNATCSSFLNQLTNSCKSAVNDFFCSLECPSCSPPEPLVCLSVCQAVATYCPPPKSWPFFGDNAPPMTACAFVSSYLAKSYCATGDSDCSKIKARE